MEIKRTSWHYRWLDWMGWKPWQAKTLCQYLGMHLQVIGLSSAVFVVGCPLLLCVSFFLSTLVVEPLVLQFGPSGYALPWTDRIGMQTSSNVAKVFWPIVTAIASAILARRFLFKFIDWITARRSTSLLKQAWQDFREKTCTRITYKD